MPTNSDVDERDQWRDRIVRALHDLRRQEPMSDWQMGGDTSSASSSDSARKQL